MTLIQTLTVSIIAFERKKEEIYGFRQTEQQKLVRQRSIEGLEFSRPSESSKATKSRPHQVRTSNPQKTSQSVGLCHHFIESINRQIKKILTTTTTP